MDIEQIIADGIERFGGVDQFQAALESYNALKAGLL